MSTILSWLSTIKLSLKQIAAISVATIISGLILALRVQGSRIHRLQVQLLELNFHASQDKQDAAVDAARAAFNRAKKAYVDNGGEPP